MYARAMNVQKVGNSPVDVRKIDFRFYKSQQQQQQNSSSSDSDGSSSSENVQMVFPANNEHRTKSDALHAETDQLKSARTFNELVKMAQLASEHMVDVGLFTGHIIPVMSLMFVLMPPMLYLLLRQKQVTKQSR